MNDLKIFENDQFGTIRAISLNGEPWFVLKDLCEILDLGNPGQVKNRLNAKGVTTNDTLTNGGTQRMIYINESNLYKTVFASRKDEAEKFTEWVTSEVLPSIRSNGGYIKNQEILTPEQIVANALVVAQNIISSKDKQIEQLTPKAEFYDQVAGSKDAIDIGTVAKVLGIKGLGRNKLFEILRGKDILMNNNQPYQKFIDCGYFRIIEQKYTTPVGETRINIKTLVYQKGLNYIRKAVN